MMIALWRAAAAATVTGGIAYEDWEACGVAIDSRKIVPGDLWVALQGQRVDGHDFIREAYRAGAAAAMVSRLPYRDQGSENRLGLLHVSDCLQGLKDLAMAARKRLPQQSRLIAVTGSVGKTSTKELLAHALASVGKVHKSEGNLNNSIGTPLSLARMPIDSAFAVIELGMSAAGEIRSLSRLASPHISVITAIHPVHMQSFPSLAAIARAKAEIFEHTSEGAVLPADSDQRHLLIAAARDAGVNHIVTFGTQPHADWRLISYEIDGKGLQSVAIQIKGRPFHFKITLPGLHSIMIGLATLAAADLVGISPERVAPSFETFAPLIGRGRSLSCQWESGYISIIDETYNASPAAMEAAAAVLATRSGRRLAVLGDMLELGERSEFYHRELAPVFTQAADKVFTCGHAMLALAEALPADKRGGHADDWQALEPMLLASIYPDDHILIKGSQGMCMDLLLQAIVHRATHF